MRHLTHHLAVKRKEQPVQQELQLLTTTSSFPATTSSEQAGNRELAAGKKTVFVTIVQV